MGAVLKTIAAMVLVGILVLLYFMSSQSGDLKRQNQISANLRSLKEIDVRWDRGIAAARSDPLSGDVSVNTPGERLQMLLDELVAETATLGSSELDNGVEGLRSAFLEKQEMVTRFEQENLTLRKTLREVLTRISGLREAGRQLAEINPELRARLTLLEGQLVSLNAELLRLYVQPDDNARRTVESLNTALAYSLEGLPESLRNSLAGLAAPIDESIKREPAATRLASQIALLPTSPRVVSMGSAFDRQFQMMAEQRELYRVYLVFYSGALLVFLAYMAWQLGRSYVKLNQVNEALKASNETLEHRVEVRTRELSEALKHLKESETMLIQSEKMSSLGQMVAGIAHEINTPLAYVKSSLSSLQERLPQIDGVVRECQRLLEMLERGETSDDELSEQFTRVSGASARFRSDASIANLASLTADSLHGIEQIAEIVVSLKNFSRLDRSRVSRFDLNEGLESALVIARNVVKHKKVIKRFAELPLIECSPSQINQVFLNLITNAAQATDEGTGEITVTTSRAAADQVRVDVADNGHGIPDHVLPKIFDPFFTTKDVGQGTGLGLSIAYKIVQEHGGRIEVKSTVNAGSVFSVFLPVKASPSQALAA